MVNSIFTMGLVIGLSVQDTTLGTTVANQGMTDVRFPAPRPWRWLNREMLLIISTLCWLLPLVCQASGLIISKNSPTLA